jgi:hypothetical protein
MAPSALLEGYQTPGPDEEEEFFPDNPRLAGEIRALHRLARNGAIPTEVADRQLNTFLLAAGLAYQLPRSALCHKLVLPITDAPHFNLLPDLGQIIHRLLARSPLPGSLSTVLEQCLPCLRHPPHAATFTDSQGVLLNLVLGLLLGLYPGGTVKRPSFQTRARIYTRVHGLLTSPPEAQTAFCRDHRDVVLLASMEYVARVLPAHMPAQARFLSERDPGSGAYFRRVAALCDELRQTLDDASDWPGTQAACALAVERVSRLKKAGSPSVQRDPSFDPSLLRTLPDIAAYWDAPLLRGDQTPDEFRLLGKALGLDGPLLGLIQRDFQVHRLPSNLRQLQLDRLARIAPGTSRATFLRTRQHVCMRCALTHKAILPTRLRLDTLRQCLICSVCAGTTLLSIDMVGRSLSHRREHYYFCPGCTRIQPYLGEDAPHLWRDDIDCQHRTKAGSAKTRQACVACGDHAGPNVVERVDHLTGLMRQFFFCARHAPRHDELAQCVNARQLAPYCE